MTKKKEEKTAWKIELVQKAINILDTDGYLPFETPNGDKYLIVKWKHSKRGKK